MYHTQHNVYKLLVDAMVDEFFVEGRGAVSHSGSILWSM